MLTPMTVAEDYRATGLSLGEHSLALLRADLPRTGDVGCADLARTRNGGRVAVAGLVPMGQKPSAAKGTMFITLEDESGMANLIVWSQLFRRQGGLVPSAGLLSCRGRVQHQVRVTQVVAEGLTDFTFRRRRISELDLNQLPAGRRDAARHGGSPDPRPRLHLLDGAPIAQPRDIYIPDVHVDGVAVADGTGAAPAIRVRARDFR